MSNSVAEWTKPDYGIDAPKVLRNLLGFGVLAAILFFVTPRALHLGPVTFLWHPTLAGVAVFLLAESALYVIYVKLGKFRHRDFMFSLYSWRGDERVLDVGCGRGLLLAGAAKRLTSGHVTGIDVWSNEDMGGNSAAATQRNLELEGLQDRCTIVEGKAQQMPFGDASFDAVVSNLCLHNIHNKQERGKAVEEIARVLRPGGIALISDYKLTGEYARELAALGFAVQRRWGSFVTTFPPLRVVIAEKPVSQNSMG